MEEIIDIIQKKIKNETFSPEEERRFQLWISSAKNSDIFEDYKKVWELTKSSPKVLVPDVNLQWEIFKTLRAKKTAPVPTVKRIYKAVYALAALVILFVGLTVILNTLSSEKTFVTSASPLEVQLDDNSLVFLNKNSTLTVSRQFNQKTRTVALTGEAMFDVQKNQFIPFVVELPQGLKIKVLGTKFNLRTYNTDDKFELKVLEGKVLFENDEQNVVVEKGYEVNYLSTAKLFSDINTIDKNLLAWHTKHFDFDNTPINEVIVALGRFIDKSIIVPNNISKVRYTGTFDNPTESEVAEVIAMSLGWDYKITKKSLIFTAKKKLK